MRHGTHKLASVSGTWRISLDGSEPNIVDTLDLYLICQCGAVLELSWKFDPAFAKLMDALVSGLTSEAYRLSGPPDKVALSPGSYSDWLMI